MNSMSDDADGAGARSGRDRVATLQQLDKIEGGFGGVGVDGDTQSQRRGGGSGVIAAAMSHQRAALMQSIATTSRVRTGTLPSRAR